MEKIVRLPTAQPRKVMQPQNKAARAARKALRDVSPFEARYINPTIREQFGRARALLGLRQSPETLFMTLLIETLDADKIERIKARLEQISHNATVLHGEPSAEAEQCLAMIAGRTMNCGEMVSLHNAMDILRDGGLA